MLINENHSRKHAGDPCPGYLARRNPAFGHEFANHFGNIPPPLPGVLLRPIGVRGMKGDGPRGAAQNAAGRVDQHTDGGGGADIEAEENGHRLNAAWKPDP